MDRRDERGAVGAPHWAESLIRKYHETLYRQARSMLPDAGDAGDVVQEVFAAFLAKERPDEVADPKTYLSRMLHNKVVDWFRKRRPDDTFDSSRMSVMAGGTGVSTRVGRTAAIRDALRSIPMDEQVAVLLHYVEGYTLEETAEVLGVSRSTAIRRIRSGCRALERMLARWRSCGSAAPDGDARARGDVAMSRDGEQPSGELDPSVLEAITRVYRGG